MIIMKIDFISDFSINAFLETISITYDKIFFSSKNERIMKNENKDEISFSKKK